MQNGFTLIELLVVVLIIGILSAVALPQYNKAVYKARMVEAETIMNSVYRGAQLFKMEAGAYPEKFEDMSFGLPSGCKAGDGYGVATSTCLDKMTCGNVTYCLTNSDVVTSFQFNRGFCQYCHFNKNYATGRFICRVAAAEVDNGSYFYRYCRDVGHQIAVNS